MSLDRRDFLKKFAAAQAGLMWSGPVPVADTPVPNAERQTAPRSTGKAADVIVVGAGAFGGWTAYYLRQLGASVKLVDAYGPGNSRATSGDETRGVHSSYGDKGIWAELWMNWASQAIDRWAKFDAEWGREMKMRLFFNTGDMIFRPEPEPFTTRTQELWKKLGIPFRECMAGGGRIRRGIQVRARPGGIHREAGTGPGGQRQAGRGVQLEHV